MSAAGAVSLAMAAAVVLAGCGGEPPTALDLDICVGETDMPPSGSISVTLVQGGRTVAEGRGLAAGSAMAFGFTVPDLPTDVFLNGQPFLDVAGAGGSGNADPVGPEASAPTDEQLEAAGHADAAHTRTVSVRAAGCSVSPESSESS